MQAAGSSPASGARSPDSGPASWEADMPGSSRDPSGVGQNGGGGCIRMSSGWVSVEFPADATGAGTGGLSYKYDCNSSSTGRPFSEQSQIPIDPVMVKNLTSQVSVI